MFALSMGPGMDLSPADVCLTPMGPVVTPVPYPNTAMSSSTVGAAMTVLTECTPTLNMASVGLVSLGNQSGVLLGAVSHIIAGQTTYNIGCSTIMIGGAPAQRLTSITGQNCMGVVPNTVGVCTVPSQVTLLTLG